MALADDCHEFTGSGCGALVSRDPVECPNERGEGDTHAGEEPELELRGNGWLNPESECAAVPGGSAPWLLLLLLAGLARRWALLVLVGCLVPFGPLAHAADAEINAEQFVPTDGGEALTVLEADPGHSWSWAVAATWTYADAPVIARVGEAERVLLDGVGTLNVGASVRVANGPRLGVLMRRMEWSYLGRVEEGLGDSSLWLLVPIFGAPERGLHLSGHLGALVPTGPSAVFLSDQGGAVDGGLSARWYTGMVTVDGQAVVRLQQTMEVGNLRWGPQLRWALALTGRPFGHGLGGVEFFGGVPFAQGADAAAQTPVEVIATAGGCLRWGICLRGGGGGGLNWGLGAPSTRAVVVLDYRRPPERDTDVDGILDLRDRCVREPEDVDLVEDGDGCPESDADGDGIGDGPDVCPDVAETWNEHLDDDGCPDRVIHVDLLVRGVPDVPTETAIVDGVGPESATIMVGEVARMKDLGGTHSFSVEAEGYRPYQGELSAVEGNIQLVVDLEPIRYGRVLLRLVDATGKGLPGWVRRPGVEGGAPEAVEGEGTAFRAETRTQSWTVYAAGHAARVVPVEPVQSGDLALTVTLLPSDVRVEGDQLRTDRSLSFDLDRAELRPEAIPVLDDIVALLLARPDIELVRVEGHADESGTSRHNLELSRARAQAVVAALVGRGVEAARLEAIGSGEARESGTQRSVDFTILVWKDE